MALNITNRTVEEKAIRVSKLLGKNKTAAVEAALDDFLLRHEGNQERETILQEVAGLLDGFSQLPVLDDRSINEIIGYNERGLL